MFVGGRNRFDTLVKGIQCTFSTKWLVCAYHTVVFKTKISQFKTENAPTKDRNGKEFDLVFFAAENLACFGPPKAPMFSVLYSQGK